MTASGITIERLDTAGAMAAAPVLSGILIDCVAGGAGVNFMHPLTSEKALAYWRDEVVPAVSSGNTALLVARRDGRLAGTVQLILAMRENQPHRGEIAKLLVAPRARRQGVARALMQAAHDHAAAADKTLLVLDTADDGAERLYRSLGWQTVGVVPGFALTPHGALCATTFLYKTL